jgi:hypothetical protein
MADRSRLVAAMSRTSARTVLVHAHHLEVRQHNIEVTIVQPLNGPVTIECVLDRVAGGCQRKDQSAAQRLVIVGNENASHWSSAFDS